MTISHTESALPDGVSAPYDWALAQLRIPEAHTITRGSPEVIVAVIDLGYRFHPDHRGHLWENPSPTREDRHGWDYADDDATLEYTGHTDDTSTYFRDHHAFIVGEVAAVAPACPIMVLRVGYLPGQGVSWSRSVEYAVEHGARVLIIPHGYIQGHCASGVPYFYQGTDFGYPFDNPELKRAYDEAYAAGCLIVSGVSDNRGRRAAFAPSAFEAVMAVGSSNRRCEASDTAPSSDYVEVAAPAGQSKPDNPTEQIWGTGGNAGYVPFTGGCMAAGFAGGVAALAMSHYPHMSVSQIRQILRNSAHGRGWDHRLGHGILDAAAAVSLTQEQMTKRAIIKQENALLQWTETGPTLDVEVENPGIFDIQQVLVVVYDGDPARPVDAQATFTVPTGLRVRQLGHARCSVHGMEHATITIALHNTSLPSTIYAQAFACDVGSLADCYTVQIPISDGSSNKHERKESL